MSAGRWRGAGPELAIAAITVTAVTAAAASVSGWPGVVAVAVGVVVLALFVLHGIIPRSSAQRPRLSGDGQRARAISGYAQRRFAVEESAGDLAIYESDLRPVLEHILAARLAESSGINLYADPEAARDAFCGADGDEELWRWIDPRRAGGGADRAGQRRGIPHRTLARLITRLEQL